MRETCIWEWPIRSAIWDWVMSSEEAQAQDQALALVEVGEGPLERQLVLDQLEALVLVADPLRRRRFLRFLVPHRAVERERPAVVVCLQHLQYLAGVELQPGRDLTHRRGALQLHGQLGDRFLDFGHPVVQPAGDPHGPDAVAEMPFQLAEDRRRGEGGERRAA